MYGLASARGLQRWKKHVAPARPRGLVGRPPKFGTEAWARRAQVALALPEPRNAAFSSPANPGEVFFSEVPEMASKPLLTCPKCGTTVYLSDLVDGETCPVCCLVIPAYVTVRMGGQEGVGLGVVAPSYNKGATPAKMSVSGSDQGAVS